MELVGFVHNTDKAYFIIHFLWEEKMAEEKFAGIGIGRIDREKTLKAVATTGSHRESQPIREIIEQFLKKEKMKHVPVVITRVKEKDIGRVIYFCCCPTGKQHACLFESFFSEIHIDIEN